MHMHNKLSVLLFSLCLLMAFPAQATISPSYPYNLQNGTTADASQVQANFNQVQSDVNNNAAPLASPVFTGTPAAPTAAPGTNTTQLATTAFVQANAVPSAFILLGTQTISSSTASISDTTHITSTYSHYLWDCRNLLSVTNNVDARITIKQGGVFVGGTSYYDSGFSISSGSSVAAINDNGTAFFSMTGALNGVYNSGAPGHIRFEFWQPSTVAPLAVEFSMQQGNAGPPFIFNHAGRLFKHQRCHDRG
jgi:hypothetical protein